MNCREYEKWEGYRISGFGKKEFFTKHTWERIRRRFNAKSTDRIFMDKNIFNNYFAAFLGRRYLFAPTCTDRQILDFIREEQIVILKPHNGQQGNGIQKITWREISDPKQFCANAKKNGYLIEEVIQQHPDLAAVNPYSVNTLRITAVLSRDGDPHILSAALRCGVGETIIDNLTAGGLVTSVDLAEGVLCSDSCDYQHKRYIRHPLTGCVLPGIIVPFWEEVRQLVEKAARVVPEARFVGWDVAVTEKGPLLVEGNSTSPGLPTMQNDCRGRWAEVRRYL